MQHVSSEEISLEPERKTRLHSPTPTIQPIFPYSVESILSACRDTSREVLLTNPVSNYVITTKILYAIAVNIFFSVAKYTYKI